MCSGGFQASWCNLNIQEPTCNRCFCRYQEITLSQYYHMERSTTYLPLLQHTTRHSHALISAHHGINILKCNVWTRRGRKKKMAICYIAHCFISASQIPTADTDTPLSLSRSPPTWEAVRVMLSRAAQPTRLLTPFLRHAFTTTGLWKTISFSRQMILLLNHHAEGSKGKQAALPCSILGLLRQLSWLRQIRAIVMKTSAWISSTWSWKLIHHLQNSAS